MTIGRAQPTNWTMYTFIALCAISAAAAILVSAFRPLSTLENSFWTVITLALGLLGSYLFGKDASRAAAEERVKPHARSAFRRVLTLHGGLSRIANSINDMEREENLELKEALRTLRATVTEILVNSVDALDDWRDLVPDEIASLENAVLSSHKRGDDNVGT